MSDWKIQYLPWGTGSYCEVLFEGPIEAGIPRIDETVHINEMVTGHVKKVVWILCKKTVEVWLV